MRNIRFEMALLALLACCTAHAQSEEKPYLSIGYLSNYVINPGLIVGYEQPLKVVSSTDASELRLFLLPQIGVFTLIDRNVTYMAGAELGIRRTKTGNLFASALSLGLHYLGESEKVGFAVNLGSGDRSNTEREWRNYLLPMLRYEWSTTLVRRRFFTGLGWGYALNTNQEPEMYLLFDMGIKLALKQ